jgi:hypothetical protein
MDMYFSHQLELYFFLTREAPGIRYSLRKYIFNILKF